jgi:hypothetical protein
MSLVCGVQAREPAHCVQFYGYAVRRGIGENGREWWIGSSQVTPEATAVNIARDG